MQEKYTILVTTRHVCKQISFITQYMYKNWQHFMQQMYPTIYDFIQLEYATKPEKYAVNVNFQYILQ